MPRTLDTRRTQGVVLRLIQIPQEAYAIVGGTAASYKVQVRRATFHDWILGDWKDCGDVCYNGIEARRAFEAAHNQYQKGGAR